MFLRQMRYLVALSREKHFARAAKACHVTQSTLSAGLKALERELDMRLVKRDPRFSGLTPEGERVAIWAHQIIADYDSLKQEADEFRHGLKGVLRLGVIPAAMPMIGTLTSHFAAKHPCVAIDVVSMSSAELENGLSKFELDGGLTYLDNEPLKDVRRLPLYRERYVFVTSKSGQLGAMSRISWRQAAAQKLCLLNETMQNRRILNKLAASLGVTLSPGVTTNSFLAICSHVKSGVWSSIIPHTFARIFKGCEELALVSLVDPAHSEMVGLVASAKDPLPPLARAFWACAAATVFDDETALTSTGFHRRGRSTVSADAFEPGE
jgi:DNA-binding transcriptional LysR family regulator